MNSTWWRKLEDLDEAQQEFISLPAHGRFLLEGPAGSGKTNLLLLRAQFVAGTGEKNVLIITYTKELVDFIRTGVCANGLISTTQIRTFHSWAMEHVRTYLGSVPIDKGAEFDDSTRAALTEAIFEANSKAPAEKLYSAIFVDEVQDLSVRELQGLLALSDNVCICGDAKQSIYEQDGLDVAILLGLERHRLHKHYRIGQAIARVADRLLPPKAGDESLTDACNYDPKVQGKSSADMHECASRDEQFESMLDLIKIQLVAFKDEPLAVFCTKRTLMELRERFNATDIADSICVHGVDESYSFAGKRPIHVLTIHSAKGTEFRAVHIYGAEELKAFPLNRRQLGFTAITRTKTALNAFRTGLTNMALESAFAQPSHIDVAGLFPQES